MPRFLAAVALLLTPAIAHAGTIYHFTMTSTSRSMPPSISGRVAIDGDRYRADFPALPGAVAQYDVTIALDHDESGYLLDTKNKVWMERSLPRRRMTSILFHMPGGEDFVAVKPRVRFEPPVAAETIAGHATVKQSVGLEYVCASVIDRVAVKATVQLTATYWTAMDFPPAPMHHEVLTGFASIDERLTPWFRAFEGMVVKSEVHIGRTLEGGGPTIAEETRTVIDDIASADIPEDQFRVPAGFTHAEVRSVSAASPRP